MTNIEHIRLQPIISLVNNRQYGYEVLSGLARGKCPETFFENQTPESQISLLEWQQIRLKHFPLKGKLFFNLSVATLLSAAHTDALIQSSSRNAIELQDPENMATLSASQQDTLHRHLARLRDAGFELWLDDFKAHYSDMLESLNTTFDGIKTDRSVLHLNRLQPQKVTSIIDQAQQFAPQVLVEGIETPDDLFIVLETSAALAQGFFWPEFSIPVRG